MLEEVTAFNICVWLSPNQLDLPSSRLLINMFLQERISSIEAHVPAALVKQYLLISTACKSNSNGFATQDLLHVQGSASRYSGL